MAEIGEVTRGIRQEEFWGNLEKVDSLNLKTAASAIEKHASSSGVDAHLIAVGGTVDPARRGKPHKDIDLVLVSKPLTIENGPRGAVGFDKFSMFLTGAMSQTGWEKSVSEPYFNDWENSGDGSVTFTPKDGKPIEILPVRVDSLKGSFEEYLAEQRRPYSVIF